MEFAGGASAPPAGSSGSGKGTTGASVEVVSVVCLPLPPPFPPPPPGSLSRLSFLSSLSTYREGTSSDGSLSARRLELEPRRRRSVDDDAAATLLNAASATMTRDRISRWSSMIDDKVAVELRLISMLDVGWLAEIGHVQLLLALDAARGPQQREREHQSLSKLVHGKISLRFQFGRQYLVISISFIYKRYRRKYISSKIGNYGENSPASERYCFTTKEFQRGVMTHDTTTAIIL